MAHLIKSLISSADQCRCQSIINYLRASVSGLVADILLIFEKKICQRFCFHLQNDFSGENVMSFIKISLYKKEKNLIIKKMSQYEN